jgi:hypothetical protein
MSQEIPAMRDPAREVDGRERTKKHANQRKDPEHQEEKLSAGHSLILTSSRGHVAHNPLELRARA